MFKKIKQTPVPIAALIMALCMLAGVALGNQNALNGAANGANDMLPGIKQIASSKTTYAEHILRLCQRNLPDAPETAELRDAIASLSVARTASAIAKADSELSIALTAIDAPLRAAGGQLVSTQLTGELDKYDEAARNLFLKSVEYNKKVAEAQTVYDRLPMKLFLRGMPEVYQQ